MAATEPLVGIVMGSDSDWETMERCAKQLEALGVPCEVRILSAHRTPGIAHDYARTAAERGLKVIIAAAGLAAHLAGAMAAGTSLPVIGVPMETGALNGLDALLSTVQMPPGVPVATVGIGKPGATNAAILAAQILATADATYAEAVTRFRAEQADKVVARDTAFQGRRG
ncbi:MAG: 5-(carboxyamino)imidazole ribonucleotide mutase [Planctomycetes bacterium]|nr:5-(carboxyamino)imidazole ribonucleotide mutase [Planctomycetota bacterium]